MSDIQRLAKRDQLSVGEWARRGLREARDAIGPAFQLILDLVDEVLPIEKADVLRAGEIAQTRALMSARGSAHIAIMERHKIRAILSFDADFDRWPGIKRIHRI